MCNKITLKTKLTYANRRNRHVFCGNLKPSSWSSTQINQSARSLQKLKSLVQLKQFESGTRTKALIGYNLYSTVSPNLLPWPNDRTYRGVAFQSSFSCPSLKVMFLNAQKKKYLISQKLKKNRFL
jgi:hypothetical protein